MIIVKFRSDKMQVNQKDIQRPTLYVPFFTEQMIWNSDYLEYIPTNNHIVTSSICKSAKNTIKHNISLLRLTLKNRRLFQKSLKIASPNDISELHAVRNLFKNAQSKIRNNVTMH